MRLLPRFLPLLAAAALSAAVAIPALAQGGAAPAPCNGTVATDPKGDQGPSNAGVAAGDNLDIREYYFRTVGTATTAYIKVTNLTKELPSDPTVDGVSWFAYWDDAEGVNNFVSATIDASGTPTYEFGTRDGSTLDVEGTTKGQLFEGPDGVVAISVPGAKAKANGKLLAPTAQTSINALIGVAGNGLRLFSPSDLAPDDGGGKDYTVTACGDGGGGTTPTNPTSPTSPGNPGTAPTQPVTGPNSLTLASKSVKGKNKKAISIKVRASGPVKNLTASLKKGAKRLMTGTLPAANGTVTVKLKGRKKLKKGKYVVQLAARNDDGRESRGSGKLTVR